MQRTSALKDEKFLLDFESLSKRRQKEVADFAAYLRIMEELEATKELLSDSVILERIIKGEEDIKAGRLKKWSEVREDV